MDAVPYVFWGWVGGVFVFNKRLCMGTTTIMINKGLGVFLVLFLNVCVYDRVCASSQGAFVEVRGQPAGVASPPIRREVGIKVRLSGLAASLFTC